jgi:DNA adenine methylase
MRFWRALRDHPEELAEAVAATPYGREEWKSSRDHDAEDDVEAARRLLVEVDQSFSRSRRSWSPPCLGDGRGRWQPGSWMNLPPKLLSAATRLQGVALESGDAVDLIERWDLPGSLIYVDPPYAGPHRLSRPGSSGSYKVDDDGELWPRLVDALRKLEHAAVILSGYPCEETERLGWRSLDLAMKRTVQARSGGSLPDAPKTVWLSPTLPEPHSLFTQHSEDVTSDIEGRAA